MYDIIYTECRTWPRALYPCLDCPVANLQIVWSPIEYSVLSKYSGAYALVNVNKKLYMERSTMLFSWENQVLNVFRLGHFYQQTVSNYVHVYQRVHPPALEYFDDFRTTRPPWTPGPSGISSRHVPRNRSWQMRPSRQRRSSWRHLRSLLRPAWEDHSAIFGHFSWGKRIMNDHDVYPLVNVYRAIEDHHAINR